MAALCWYGWGAYRRHEEDAARALIEEQSRVVAQLWILSAKFRDDLPRYTAFRDSLLSATKITKDELLDYIRDLEPDPLQGVAFGRALSANVDSLYAHEDSLLRPERSQNSDSVKAETPLPAVDSANGAVDSTQVK